MGATPAFYVKILQTSILKWLWQNYPNFPLSKWGTIIIWSLIQKKLYNFSINIYRPFFIKVLYIYQSIHKEVYNAYNNAYEV